MSDNIFKTEIRATTDFANEQIILEMDNATQGVNKWILETRSRVVHDALIQLGWTPPFKSSAPPIYQRALFEKFMSEPPIEADVYRWPFDSKQYAWPGHYRDYKVQLAWEAWEESWKTALRKHFKHE